MKRILFAVAITLLAAPLAHAQSAAVVIPNAFPVLSANCILQANAAATEIDCNPPGASAQPLTDAFALMADDATPTKILALQLSGLTAATTRTWTVPDLSGTVALSGAAQDVTFATITASGLIAANGGISATTGTFSSTLTVTGAATLAGGVSGNTTFTGAITGLTDVYTTAWTDYTASSTITGWSSFVAGKKWIFYKKVGKLVFVNFYIEGTSNATTTSFTLPFTAVNVGTQFDFGGVMMTTLDNGAFTGPGLAILSDNATVVNAFANTAQGIWTASGTKAISGQFWYEAGS